MTNGDKIRKMNDLELSGAIFENVLKCTHCPCYHTDICPYPEEVDCQSKIYKWLEREVDDCEG